MTTLHSADSLANLLRRIDGRGYKAYKDVRGAYDLGDSLLFVDHVQGDPYAALSRVRVFVPAEAARLDASLFRTPPRKTAFQDFLARAVRDAIRDICRGGRGSGKSGAVEIDAGAQEVIPRSAMVLRDDGVEARLFVGLPARGRRILGRQAEDMLLDELPRIARRALCMATLDEAAARRFVECVENQEHIRAQLEGRALVAFVADSSVLPRESGADDRPMNPSDAVLFRAPESLRVSFTLPNAVPSPSGASLREIAGLGVPTGVTLITGGGYHGKSTLLNAMERGIHPHIPGDGREYAVTDSRAVKVRAEDGRCVHAVDISAFIGDLPGGKPTAEFHTADASGSTSQAASIMEALEVGARALLLDEDTSATNFLVRDARMQALIAREHEPITPLVDRVRELSEKLGVSTIMVVGGCGDYFDVADTVIALRDYLPENVTGAAREVAVRYPTGRRAETRTPPAPAARRTFERRSISTRSGRREVKVDALGRDRLRFGEHIIDLRGVEQLLDPSQTRAVGLCLHLLATRFDEQPLAEALDALEDVLDNEGLDALDPWRSPHPGCLARPRRFEIAAALSRLRGARARHAGGAG